MEEPLINILIRTSNRPNEFKRCLKSVTDQRYPNIRIIISVDNDRVDYIPEGLQVIRVEANRQLPYFYDCYCNDLKALVTDGWFMYLDDDDVLAHDCLSDIVLDSPAIIHLLNRSGHIVPIGPKYVRGQIGMPCLMLHHSLKDVADIPGNGQGDYFWIKEVERHVDCVYRELVVVQSFGRGNGK